MQATDTEAVTALALLSSKGIISVAATFIQCLS
jgi:hypothetical protein